MTLVNYCECSSLEDVAELVFKAVTEAHTLWVANLCVKTKFSVTLLANPGLLDAVDKAGLWQQTSRPEELFFSHGEYLGENGIQHIADELKAKPDSNRALASLISVEHILGSADKPLPSFLVFQCMVDGPTLYVTAMYRAMEVSDFFRINLEEIRMMAKKVYEANRRVEQVALCIFVTRAYSKPGMNPLQRCEIDRIPQMELMVKHRNRLPTLLREKGRQSTYPEQTGLRNLLSISELKVPPDLQIPGNSPALRKMLQDAIDDTVELRRVRQNASHHKDIEALEKKLGETLEKIAMAIEGAGMAGAT